MSERGCPMSIDMSNFTAAPTHTSTHSWWVALHEHRVSTIYLEIIALKNVIVAATTTFQVGKILFWHLINL